MPPLTLHDSFLIRDGRALALDYHLARMSTASGCDPAVLRDAYALMLAEACSAPGWSFPRITFCEDRLEHRIRPFSPEALRSNVVLSTATEPDARTHPELKGPDFALQTALRTEAMRAGADEAVLLSPEGTVREGAFSSIVHWRDGRLILSPKRHRLPSVTETVIVREALATGSGVEHTALPPEAIIAGDEVWCLSSLHGIRIVTEWDGQPVQQLGRAEEFRTRLRGLEQDALLWAAEPQKASERRTDDDEVGP